MKKRQKTKEHLKENEACTMKKINPALNTQ